MSAVAREVKLCVFCPSLCRFACPVEAVAGRESATPRFMVSLHWHLAHGTLPHGPEAAAAFTMCDGCGACTAVCEHQNPVVELIRAGREESRRRGELTPTYRAVAESLAAGLGPGGGLIDAPLREVHPERQGRPGRLLLWPCDRSLESGPGALLATCAFLEALGVDYALPRPEAMVPSPRHAREIGAEALAAELAGRREAACRGYDEVFFEEPAEAVTPAAKTFWHLRPEAGFSWPREGDQLRGYYLAPASLDPGFAELARGLGLKDLNQGRAPALSVGSGSLFDLAEPELAARMAFAAAARAEGAWVLLPSAPAAARLAGLGVKTAFPAALRPRRTP